jgi:SAM-dependent methyltransferase
MTEESASEDGSFIDHSRAMKLDWDARAVEDAKWFINCVRLRQSEEEFDRTGLEHVRGFVTDDLELLIDGRDPRDLRVLEIGCGIGRMTRHLAGIFGEVYATDVSGEMIRQAQSRLVDLRNIQLYETNGSDFSQFPSEHFDFVFSAYVFQHIASKEIILSNIRDGYRVLKPGCNFKFLVSTVSNEEFLAMTKDTWAGASLFEGDLRGVATELGARLMAMTDLGTQYTWTIFRKPARVSAAITRKAAILEVGRAEDLANRVVETHGKGLGMLLEGIDRDVMDANNLVVEVGGFAVRPSYVGPTKGWPAGTVQVNFPVPDTHAGGMTPVRLRLADGSWTGTSEVNIVVSRPKPRVYLVTSSEDSSLELRVGGSENRLRLHVSGVEGLEESQVAVNLGGKLLETESISFVPANGTWMVIVKLPVDQTPGLEVLRLSVNGIESEAVELELKRA